MAKTKRPPSTNGQAPDLSFIAESLRPLAVPIGDLILDPANARTHSDKNLDGIKGSLAVYGQQKPVVVRQETMTVVCGNGTLAAARALGWTHLAANVVPLDAATAAGLSVADNRTSDMSSWDTTALDKLLREVNTGNDERLDAMFAEMVESLPDVKVALKELDTRPPPPMTWVLVGIPTVRFGEIAADVERIAALTGVLCETTSNDGKED